MSERKAHWEQVYASKSPLAVSWHQQTPALSLQLIHHSGIAKDAPLIDVGGGASVLVDHLLAEGYSQLTVLDISSQALHHAKTRLGAAAQRVTWLEADVTTFRPAQRFALWHDRAVFHFLTDAQERRRYAETLKQSLTADGQVIIAAFAIGGPRQCSGLDIVQYDASKLCAELGDAFRLVEENRETHVTPAGNEQTFAYFRLVGVDAIMQS